MKGTCSHFISVLCWNRSGIWQVEFLWWSKHGWKDLLFHATGSTLQASVGAVLKTSFEMEEIALKKYHRLVSCLWEGFAYKFSFLLRAWEKGLQDYTLYTQKHCSSDPTLSTSTSGAAEVLCTMRRMWSSTKNTLNTFYMEGLLLPWQANKPNLLSWKWD